MSPAAILRVGWCPGALRPMRSGDGLLVRVKPFVRGLTPYELGKIARLADQHGNGFLDLTQRGNLQIRGVSDATLKPLLHGLSGLGLLDKTPEAEAVRNLLVSPLAGFDPQAVFDIMPSASSLEAALRSRPVFQQLPAKFAFAMDDGGRFGLNGITADIAFRVAMQDGQQGFLVELGPGQPQGFCAVEALAETAERLVAAFLDVCAAAGLEPHRMADLLRQRSAEDILSRAAVRQVRAVSNRHRALTAGDMIGREAEGSNGPAWLGMAPAFGRWRGAQLQLLAELVEAHGAGPVRLTPWRTLLLPGLGQQQAESLLGAMMAAVPDCVFRADDPRLRIATCAGMPACQRASVDVRAEAERLAPFMSPTAVEMLHLSGCAKGCAHPGAAPLCFVGRNGRFDLVRNGRAGDVPEQYGLPGESLASVVVSRSMEPVC